MNKELYGDSYGEQFRKYEEKTVELEKKIKEYKKQINLKEKALARIKRENESLIDQNAMYEFFYEGNGFYKRGLNNSIMIEEYIEKLEKDNRLLEQRGSDILKELLDKNKRYKELERQIEKMKCCGNCKHFNRLLKLCVYSMGDETHDCRLRNWELWDDE